MSPTVRIGLRALVFAALATPALAAEADDPAALPEARPHNFSARVEPDRVELGRPFRLILEVRHDPREIYALAGEPAVGGLTLRGAPAAERTEADGAAVTRIVLELVAFDALGERELPEQTLIADGPEGRARLVVPGPPLEVVAISGGETLENPAPEPLFVTAWERIALAAGGLLALALAAFAFRRWRHRRRGPEAPPIPIDRRTPEERALAELSALEADTALPIRDRYFRLSAIVRGFLAAVSDLPAVDRTSEELLDQLSRRAIPGLDPAAFRAWLARGDLVRFARAHPAHEAVVADHAEAASLVRAVAAAIRAEQERRRAAAAASAGPGGDAPAGGPVTSRSGPGEAGVPATGGASPNPDAPAAGPDRTGPAARDGTPAEVATGPVDPRAGEGGR